MTQSNSERRSLQIPRQRKTLVAVVCTILPVASGLAKDPEPEPIVEPPTPPVHTSGLDENSKALLTGGAALKPVKPGRFKMGSEPEALQRDFIIPDRVLVEQPALNVIIRKHFLLGWTEVTVAQYAAFIEATEHESADCLTFNFEDGTWENAGHDWRNPGFEQTDEHPVVCVSWHDAVAYTQWLSTEYRGFRLPTEAEWEYVARAGSQSLFAWGEEKDEACEYANVADQSGIAAGVASAQAGQFECDDGHVFTAPADFGKPNPWGFRGMIGNAGEWVQDCMVRTLEGMPADGSARETTDCEERTMRGGSWFNPPMYARPAFRYGTNPNSAFNLVGFRIAADRR